MVDLPAVPDDLVLRTDRLRLDPVTRRDADELRDLHADPELFRHTRRPSHVDRGLEAWLAAQETRASPTGTALWLTWLVRPAAGGGAVGQAQATVVAGEGGPQAELSWLLARAAQGQGYATEAARAVAGWLRGQLGVARLHAHIAPANPASERVAERLGLTPGSELLDGERLWSDPA